MKDEDVTQLMPAGQAAAVSIVSKEMLNNNNNNNSEAEQKPAGKVKPLGERTKAVRRQELMVFLGNIGVLGAGMVISMPAVTLSQLMNPEEAFTLNSDEASWYASINNMTCPLGALLVGYLMDRIGRRYTIVVTNLLGVVGWLLLATCFLHNDRDLIYAQLLLGRCFGGIMLGMYFSPVGVYSAEISLTRIRGRLILGTSIALGAGILAMYVLGYFIRSNFVLLCYISICYQCVATVLVFPMPESPSWLMQKGRAEPARKSLKYFRGLRRKDSVCVPAEFEAELAQMQLIADTSRTTAANESLTQAIRHPEVYKPVLMLIGFFFCQQTCGVVVVIVYAVQIAEHAGVAIDPVLVAVMVGVARIVMTCCMSSIFEYWGRRPAGMFSASGMGLCMLLLAAGGWWPATVGTWTWLPVVCIVAHIVFSTMGLLTLPFFMISEVFPQRARGSASGIAVFFSMIIAFVMLKIYPNMKDALGMSNLFCFYAVASFLSVGYVFLCVPETRGRTLPEIEEYWRTGKRGPGAGNANLKEVELREVFLKK